MIAKVENVQGLPAITVNGKPITEMAYITYRTDQNRYADFAKIGVKLYSVNLNFSEMPINETAPVLVFQKGIFEHEEPDFSIVDKNFDQILAACPDAYIFPRVNMNLSEAWEKAHPDELCEKGYNERKRFSFASDIWAEEVKRQLGLLVNYIENSRYKERIIGYQLAAGNTEEWLPIDPQSGYGPRANEKFLQYCKENGLEKTAESYYTFMSELIAMRIMDFAAVVKQITNRTKLVGTFYGYVLLGRFICHHALGRLLRCEYIDFLSSPASYTEDRAPGIDPYPQLPPAALRHHGKLYLAENDIRTHLSRYVHDHPNYTKPVWLGQKKSIATEQLKLSYCRAMLYGYGMWWFDMWGGWYDDPDYMALMEKMRKLCEHGMDIPDTDLAVFLDEKAMTKGDPRGTDLVLKCVREIGLCGTPYDLYLTSDFNEVFDRYKACIFIEPAETALSNRCIEKALSEKKSVKVLTVKDMPAGVSPEEKSAWLDTNIAADELRDWLVKSGCEVAVNRKAVVYRGKRYSMLYAPEDGEYDFCDKGKKVFVDVFTGEKIHFPAHLTKAKCLLFERG